MKIGKLTSENSVHFDRDEVVDKKNNYYCCDNVDQVTLKVHNLDNIKRKQTIKYHKKFYWMPGNCQNNNYS